MFIQIIFILFLVTSSQAYTRFDTTCTIPTIPTNFVSSPDSRGTLDILWSCLFTIIACTWTIQHLNIPEQRNNLRENMERRKCRHNFRVGTTRFLSRLRYDIKEGAIGFWADLIWGFGDFWTNLKWMIFTILVPEFILGKAIGDFLVAWKLKQTMEAFAIEDNVEWGLSHGFFTGMGGFRAAIPRQSEPQNEAPIYILDDVEVNENEEQRQPSDNAIEFDNRPQLQHSLVREKPYLPPASSTPEVDGQDIVDSYILSGPNIFELRSTRMMERLPGITTAEIHDRGKTNIFVKAVAVIQVLWMAVQVIVRSVRGLAISQLELMATAFSLCAIINYLFLLQKPQGVQTPARPIKVDGYRLPNRWLALRSFFLPISIYSDINVKYAPRARVPNDFVHDEIPGAYAFSIAFGSSIFGAIHVAGWNLSFPTSIDQELWRISSILITCLLPIFFSPTAYGTLEFIFDLRPRKIVDEVMRAWGWAGWICVMSYMVARLILLVETFRTLVFLPQDAFVSTWVSNIPNVN